MLNNLPDMNTPEIEPIEPMEQLLTGLQKDLSPSAEFSERMKKRLERHHVLMQERHLTAVGAETGRRGFFSFFASHIYSTVTAFAFVIFTGGLSTFAYTSEGVTNGSPLYPIKRGLESIEQAFVSSNPEAAAEYHVKMLSRRLAESRVLTLRGVVDTPTNEAVVVFANSGLEAIQSLETIEYRDQLFNRMTTLLQEEERKMYHITGLPVSTSNEASSSVNADTATESTTSIAPPAVSGDVVRSSNTNTSRTDGQSITEQRIEEKRPRPEDRTIRPSVSTPTPVRPSSEAIRENVIVPLGVPDPVVQAIEQNSRQLQRIELQLHEVRRRR